MLEKTKLKKKSKYLKKPLELKNTISETLAHNARAEAALKREAPKAPPKAGVRSQAREAKLQELYEQVELQHKSSSETDSSEEMLLADLQRREEDEVAVGRDKRAMLFSHLVRDSGHLRRKLSALEERVDEKIRKYSTEAKIKQMSSHARIKQMDRQIKQTDGQIKQTGSHLTFAHPHRQQNLSLLPKGLERQLGRLSEEGATEVRLVSMQLSHLSLVRMKEQLSGSGRLRVVDLSYNSLGNKSVGLLAEVLAQNAVEELSVKWNQLGHEGAGELLQAVTASVSLTSLDLSYNKLTNSSVAFLESCQRLLAENKYLVHLNLEMCQLAEQQCAALAKAYNLANESILCLHFRGNSHYHVNKLGYITRAPHCLPDSSSSFPSPSPPHFSRHLIADDCCWLCLRWAGETFRIAQEVLPAGLACREEELFIHLSCYDFQPIRLSNEECANSLQPRKDCRHLEWCHYEVHLAQIPVPANKDLRFFFTISGRPLISHDDPSVEVAQLVSFQPFDVFAELSDHPHQPEKYSVFVQWMNTRKKEELGVNKLKRLRGEACESSFKEAFRRENEKALQCILSKSKKASTHSPAIEPLPRLSRTRPATPTHSRTPSAPFAPSGPLSAVINVRKCKEKPPPSAQNEKYFSLGMTPRNKQFLFNYRHFSSREGGVGEEELRRVQEEYFGSCREGLVARFLRQREMGRREEPFMDRFKLLTRRFFNSHELFFSDVFSFLYSTFVSLEGGEREREAKAGKNNKSVKFEAAATKLSILINSEKQLKGNVGTEAGTLGSQGGRTVERRALSMNCISDKYQLSKLKAMPAGSIHTLHSNLASTDKTIKSFKDIPVDHTTLLPLSLDLLPPPLDLTEEAFARYTTLATRYGREKRVVLELISGCDRNCEKEKLRELNEIILTFNYHKLTLFYEETVQKGLEALLAHLPSFSALVALLPSQPTTPPPLPFQQRKSSNISGSLQGVEAVQDLQALEKQISSQSAAELLASLGEFLGSEEHFLKVLLRSEGAVMKSSKKRKGKYGRSLKKIKDELVGEQSKVVLPDSEQFLQEIEQEERNAHYNALVRHLNALADPVLRVLDRLVADYLAAHSCGEERGLVEQWLRAHLSARIASFPSDQLARLRTPALMGQVRARAGEVCEQFALHAVVELARASLLLGSSALQQNLKEYQFVSPFHSYEFILAVETTKLTHIARALQDSPLLLRLHLAEVLRLLADCWGSFQLEQLRKERAKKEAEATRKMKRLKTINSKNINGKPTNDSKTINDSLDRALPPKHAPL